MLHRRMSDIGLPLFLVGVRKSQSSFSPKPYNAALELGAVPVDAFAK
jgi:hypothetical protein